MEVPTNKTTTILIVGAGIGGLSFYHSVRKNLDRWQGYNIYLHRKGVTSLFYCTPPEIQARFPEAMPDPTPSEYHTSLLTDHIGRRLLHKPHQKTKNVYEIEPLKHDYAGIVSYRNVLREVLLEGVDIQWGKKCVGYEESDDGVWALFADGTREFGDLLIGADGINSPKSFDPGVTSVTVDIAIPNNLSKQLMSIYSNSIIQESLGKNGDFHLSFFRLIPIDQSEEPTYRGTIAYIYPTRFDIKDNISIDDNDLESIIKHTISRIRQLRPPCELTN
ncbi:FAD/NADP-binding domain-containing protein [Gigaspora margarita]|uniref:FAD/NADP-binding domain-containing protein n=1 Tax=Gigaspora margarita TaxID=4874 RepID=A0A8H4EWA7_GIGMA|nr:FAD/NADP-binding domain-containing protein [Gigaspora margarita]